MKLPTHEPEFNDTSSQVKTLKLPLLGFDRHALAVTTIVLVFRRRKANETYHMRSSVEWWCLQGNNIPKCNRIILCKQQSGLFSTKSATFWPDTPRPKGSQE